MKVTVNTTTTIFVGNYYEMSGSVAKKYYYAGSLRIAVRTNTTLQWLVGDHLGSTSITANAFSVLARCSIQAFVISTPPLPPGEEMEVRGSSITANASGVQDAKLLYKPWGENRYTSGTTPTTYHYTGQREQSEIGLYYYGARWYDSATARFAQADSIIPNPGYPQAWDRYAYVNNNPLKYTDPSDFFTEDAIKQYLQSQYGAEWQYYWNLWSADSDWMRLLYDAQAGDLLFRTTYDEDGNALAEGYLFGGEGQDVLTGIYHPDGHAGDLQDVFSHSVGVASVRPNSNDNGLKIRKQRGDIEIQIREITDGDMIATEIFIGVALFTLSLIPLPKLALGKVVESILMGTAGSQLMQHLLFNFLKIPSVDDSIISVYNASETMIYQTYFSWERNRFLNNRGSSQYHRFTIWRPN